LPAAAEVACLGFHYIVVSNGVLFRCWGGAFGLAVPPFRCGVGQVCLLADLTFQEVMTLGQQLDLVLHNLNAGRQLGL